MPNNAAPALPSHRAPIRRLRWLAPALAVLLGAGCASVSTTPSAAPEHAAALSRLDQGQPREAAQRLEALATGAQVKFADNGSLKSINPMRGMAGITRY